MAEIIVLTTLSLLLFFALGFAIGHMEHPSDKTPQAPDLEKTQQKSWNILHHALGQAGKIMTNAELAGIKLFSQEKLEGKKHAEHYRQRLAEMENEFARQLETILAETNQEHTQALHHMQEKFTTQMQQHNQNFDREAATIVGISEKSLNGFMETLQGQIKAETQDALEKTRLEIDAYKKSRLAMIDSHVVDVITLTLAKTLPQTLTIKDHLDILYKSLEEAKKENAFG